MIWQDDRLRLRTTTPWSCPTSGASTPWPSWAVTDKAELQLNVENLFDEEYFPDAHSNPNITPGAGRLFRASLKLRY